MPAGAVRTVASTCPRPASSCEPDESSYTSSSFRWKLRGARRQLPIGSTPRNAIEAHIILAVVKGRFGNHCGPAIEKPGLLVGSRHGPNCTIDCDRQDHGRFRQWHVRFNDPIVHTRDLNDRLVA